MPERVSVYIDSQNTYMGARDAFFGGVGQPTDGQFDPMRLAQRIVDKGAGSESRELAQVRVYTGRPSSSRDARGYAANRRQSAAWANSGVMVIARILRYPPRGGRPREKGIDVSLAVDFVAGAVDDTYDVGVIVSTDTDLVPALEFVTERFSGMKNVETAAWSSPISNKPLRLGGASMRCHYLDRQDFEIIRDDTLYVR